MENIIKYLKQTTLISIICLIIIGASLRFFNLNWGDPYYFHPDERNVATSAEQIQIPNQLNPHFFAYGTLPIYTSVTVGIIRNIFYNCYRNLNSCFIHGFKNTWGKTNSISFTDAIIIGRFFSALLSTLLIPLVYLVGKKIHSRRAGIFSSFFTATSVGLIQFAHFGTFEIWSTFFSTLLYFYSIKLIKDKNVKHLFVTGCIMGILTAIKISNLVLLAIPILSIISNLSLAEKKERIWRDKIITIFQRLKTITILCIVAAFVYLLTNPFVILDFPAFKNSIKYESAVATGKTEVFYTQEFFSTTPVLFQLYHVYPFLINPLLTLVFILSFFYLFWKTIKVKNRQHMILLLTFLFLFTSQAFLFVKWTRYMVPTLPFIYLIIGITAANFTDNFKKKKLLTYSLYFTLISVCILYAFAYFKTVLVQEDTRITAAKWAERYLPSNATVLSEVYDIGITAFQKNASNTILCSLYELESNKTPCNDMSLKETLAISDYVILPSERIMKSRLLNKKRYPKGNEFYKTLLSSPLQYQLVYKTDCDLLCKILYLGDPLYSFEQTASVFDRPTIYIFEKLTIQTYNTNSSQ